MNDTPPPQPQPQSPPPPPAQGSVQGSVQSAAKPQPEAVAVAPKPKAAAPAATPKDAPDSAPQKPLPEAQDDTTFNTSVRDAYALLDFATRRGMVIPNEITTTIVKTYDKVAEHDPIQVQDQATFWVAFRDIIDLVKPVTVESILFSAPKTDTSSPKWWWNPLLHSTSPADRVLKRYLFFAMTSLLLLLVLQMEWAIGTSTYNDAFESHTYLTNTQEQLEDAELKVGAKVTPSVDGASSDAVTLSSQNDVTLKKLQLQHDKDQSWDDVSYVRLWWWNRQSAKLFPPYDLSISNDDDDSAYIEYIWLNETASTYSPHEIDAIATRLAAELAPSIKGKADWKAELMEEYHAIALPRAIAERQKEVYVADEEGDTSWVDARSL